MLSIRARAARVLVRSGVKSLRRLPIRERRARIERLAGRFKLPRGTVVAPLRATGLRGEWVSVPASSTNRVILYLHGGAFCMGSSASHRKLVALICAQSHARALSLDYRLAPEHPFPAALEDAAAAYRWLLASGIASRRIAFAGDSAGANIALAALIMLRDAGDPPPAAAACISPPTDLTAGSASLTSRARLDPLVSVEAMVPLLRAYEGSADPGNPLVSPLLADLHGLPPLLIQVGSREILHDDSLRFARKAREANVDVTFEVGHQLWHVWHAAAPYVPEARAAILRIGRFLRERIPDE